MEFVENGASGAGLWAVVPQDGAQEDETPMFVIRKTNEPTDTDDILDRFSAPVQSERATPELKEISDWLDSLVFASKNGMPLPNPPTRGRYSEPILKSIAAVSDEENEAVAVAQAEPPEPVRYSPPELTTFVFPSAASEEEKAAWSVYFKAPDNEHAPVLSETEPEPAAVAPPALRFAPLETENVSVVEAEAIVDLPSADVDVSAHSTAGLWEALLSAIADNPMAYALARQLEEVYREQKPTAVQVSVFASEALVPARDQEPLPEAEPVSVEALPEGSENASKVLTPAELLSQLDKLIV